MYFSGPADCTQTDEHDVTCTAGAPGFDALDVDGGGGDDVVRVTGMLAVQRGESVPAATEISGGIGSDTLFGTDGSDMLTGGSTQYDTGGRGGVDVLHGGNGDDTLQDADPVGARDADQLDGGAGTDRVTYATRHDPVVVNLAAGRGGAPGENDVLTGIENATGGRGADTLMGDAGPNVLYGGSGAASDTLIGGGGADTLLVAGHDSADGGSGDDLIDLSSAATGTTVRCGTGRDLVVAPPRPTIAGDCEKVGWTGGRLGPPALVMSAQPVALRPGGAVFSFACASSATPARTACTGVLALTRAVGGRGLGSVRVALRRGRSALLVVPLAAADVRAIRARGGLPVKTRFTSASLRSPRSYTTTFGG